MPFLLNRPDQLHLYVQDVSGRIFIQQEGFFEAGHHQFDLSLANLPQKGVFFYAVQGTATCKTGKFIRE